MRLASRGPATCAVVACTLVVRGAVAEATPAQPPAATAGIAPAGPVDGPSADIIALGGVAQSPDGSGGVVYIRRDGGVAHVFVLRSVAGALRSPERVDVGLDGPATAAVIAAGDRGRLAVAFVEAGAVYASIAPAAGAPFGPPQLLSAGGVEPAVAMSRHGSAYVVFATSGVPAQLRAAHAGLVDGTFTVLDGVLNLDPSRSAGDTDTKRAAVAASSDGTAMVAWTEDGAEGRTHVLERRVLRGSLDAAPIDANLPALNGRPGGAADGAGVAVAANSGFAIVSLRQSFDDGSGPRPRALARTLRGDAFDGQYALDGLAFPLAQGAGVPALGVNQRAAGFAAAALDGTHDVMLSQSDGHSFELPAVANDIADTIDPAPVVATGSTGTGVLAWRQSGGPADPPAVRARRVSTGSGLGAAGVLSSPSGGPVAVGAGFGAATDATGDALVAFVQGAPGAYAIEVGQSAAPPPGFPILGPVGFHSGARVGIAWGPSDAAFGPVRYSISVDGALLGTTPGRATVSPPLADGVHTVAVTASDARGMATTERGSFGVDRLAPRISISKQGSAAAVGVTDPLPPPAAGVGRRASGVARVTIDWGDGTRVVTHGRRVTHPLSGGGHVTVVAVDHAGNVARAHRRV